ncbi:gem-associated protein 5 [Synchiropus picturatus]
MHERCLPPSPNWYCSRCSDVNSSGLFGVGAKNVIYLIEASASCCRVVGELVGHKNLVSGFSFCHHEGQRHMCVSSATDGTLLYWDTDSRTLLEEHAAHQNPVAAVHWSPVDKNLVVSGDEKGVVVCRWLHTRDTVSFFPEPRTIFCLTCSPHSWSCVAIGYKDGMIVLVDVSKKGQVTHRLRGHDDEIHSLVWCPLENQDSLFPGYSNTEVSDEQKSSYLASGSRDQTVRIWSTTKGKVVTTLKLPFLKKRGSAVDPSVKERLWLNVHWPSSRPMTLVTSCFGGELVTWDLSRLGKQRWTLLGTSGESQNHSRIVFNMSSVHLQDKDLLISTSMDREVKCWDLESLDCCWTLPTLGGFVYALTFAPVATGCLALGVGDNSIRVWNTLATQNQYETRTFWQGLKSKVTALSWHPLKEGSLSFGTDDGKVGIYDVFSNKPPQVSSSYHKRTVYTLAWGPPVPPLSFGAAGGKPTFSLYSCGGEGVILQHDPAKLSGDACDIDRLIRDTNNIKHKLSPHTDLTWKPDGKVVAIGNEDGCIEIYQAPSLKLLCSIQQHHKIINVLRWHHQHDQLHGLLASGSSNAVVYVHDLRSVIETPPEAPLVLTEPHRRLAGHTAKITNMAWSPHHSARLATVSYDGTAQVWDVLQEAPLANYRGHMSSLLCVDWSPVDPDLVWTGGKDFTLQEWRVSGQEFSRPPKGKKMVELQEKNKKKNTKKTSKKTSEPAADTNAGSSPAAPEASDEDDASSTSSSAPPPVALVKSRDRANRVPVPDINQLKKKKARSLLPITSSMDNRPKEDLLQDCVTLAQVTHGPAPPAGCTLGQGDHIHLGLFSDRPALIRLLQEEEQGHLDAGHLDSVVYLRLWSGDLEGALQLATERGELNDHLLSIAPMAGFRIWSRAVDSYVQQLCLQEQHVKAASHLLSINKVQQAIELLRDHKLYREAVALARARLPADDPVLTELYSLWGSALEKSGHFSAAAKCFIATGSTFDAAKVVARKNDPASLRAAAALARISGEEVLARSLALRCAKDLAASHDWVQAQEVLSLQPGMLAHRLHLCVAELLTIELDPPMTTRVSSHCWAAPGPGLFMDRIKDVWDRHFGVSRDSYGPCGEESLLQELQSVESPEPSANTPLRQVILQVSLHLSRSILTRLLDDPGQSVKDLWRAVSWLMDAGHWGHCARLCIILFPGNTQVGSGPQVTEVSEDAGAASSSLQALVYYHRLYQICWTGSAGPARIQNGHPASDVDTCPEDLVQNGVQEPPVSLDFDLLLLLSEPHAACQSCLKSMTRIREQLSQMVLQHSPVQPEDLKESQDNRAAAEQSANESESFLSLSMKMSELQKQLDDVPDTIKLFSRPDVMECSLVLLHLSRTSPSVPEALQNRAKDLLQRYGTDRAILKAAKRFLH